MAGTDEAIANAFGFQKTEPPQPKPNKPEPPPQPLSLAQAIYSHLRVNDGKQPFSYVGNPITFREGKGKMFNPMEPKK